MNELEAKLIIRCKMGKKLTDLLKLFEYRYDYIAKICSNLASKGYLKKRKFRSPSSHKIVVYYSATIRGINEALDLLNSKVDEKIGITTTKSLMEYVKKEKPIEIKQ